MDPLTPYENPRRPIDPPDPVWEAEWRAKLQYARDHPGMFIGGPVATPLHALNDVLRFIGLGRPGYHGCPTSLFTDPGRANALISPSQFVVKCEAGPLVPKIEQLIELQGTSILTDEWRRLHEAVFNQPRHSSDPDPALRALEETLRGPTGPRLYSMSFLSFFSHYFVCGINTTGGFRYQAFEGGWPTSAPVVIPGQHKFGVLIIASLDVSWFPKLPFKKNDIEQIRLIPGVEFEWHDTDDLVDESITHGGVLRWLGKSEG